MNKALLTIASALPPCSRHMYSKGSTRPLVQHLVLDDRETYSWGHEAQPSSTLVSMDRITAVETTFSPAQPEQPSGIGTNNSILRVLRRRTSTINLKHLCAVLKCDRYDSSSGKAYTTTKLVCTTQTLGCRHFRASCDLRHRTHAARKGFKCGEKGVLECHGLCTRSPSYVCSYLTCVYTVQRLRRQ